MYRYQRYLLECAVCFKELATLHFDPEWEYLLNITCDSDYCNEYLQNKIHKNNGEILKPEYETI